MDSLSFYTSTEAGSSESLPNHPSQLGQKVDDNALLQHLESLSPGELAAMLREQGQRGLLDE